MKINLKIAMVGNSELGRYDKNLVNSSSISEGFS